MKDIIEINNVQLNGALTILNLNANMDQLENAVKKELEKTPLDEPVQESKQEPKEEVKTVPNPYHISNDEKVMKTLSCTIRVPKDATNE